MLNINQIIQKRSLNVCHQRTRISDCPTVMGHFGKSWIENNVMTDSLKFCFYFFKLTKGKRKG